MLDVMKNESMNEVTVAGVLKELVINESTWKSGKDGITCRATVSVDQDIDGIVYPCSITVSRTAAKLKNDGTPNPMYDDIKKMGEKFTSAAATNDESKISHVVFEKSKVRENAYVNRQGEVTSTWDIQGGWVREAHSDERGDQRATFELVGVIAKMTPFTDRDETERLKISLVVVGFGGRCEVVDLIADGNPKSFIEQNWEKGETVKVTGFVKSTVKIETYYEEQGFGPAIPRTKTVGCRELYITGGSQSGFEEELSYDADQIKAALDERKVRLEKVKEKANEKPAAKPKPTFDF